ncbi:MAG: class I SAM-dependent methyltransferase, partial [Gemmatimonadetes bacterium]|nr:class I SAM-dependent methyltransferase [Gemmatimonadota bacterium]
MSDPAERYYETLAADYAVKIRQLVPRYDEMLEVIATAVCLHLERHDPEPAVPATMSGTLDVPHTPTRFNGGRRILDIGAGSGEVTALLLQRLDQVEITAVEPSDAMLGALRARLGPWSDRVRIEKTDALNPPLPLEYHAVVTNLVLHNLGNRDKRKALRRIHSTLARKGSFVWGDMVVRPDRRFQDAVNTERALLARAAGCAE